MITRLIENKIKEALFKGKVLLLYGARQVGKTTLVKQLVSEISNSLYLNCDEPDIRVALENQTSTALKAFIGQKTFVVIDEAQRVPNIGLTLKLLIDQFPEVQCLATGSSAFELMGSVKEPLTGRKKEFTLYPISFEELKHHSSALEAGRLLERRMIVGCYPEVIQLEGTEAEDAIRDLASSYLYKDILMFNRIRNSDGLVKLVQALALQLGQEVSPTELSQLLGMDKNTVTSYIRILEQSFVVFRLPSYNKNLRNELKRSQKIYFCDNGIRNAVINQFSPLALRQDIGALWENFMLSERLKYQTNMLKRVNRYFWRTHSQQEIDYIEEGDGPLKAYEFKWKPTKKHCPPLFAGAYPNAQFEVIHPESYWPFISDTAH
jgi:predicted AAA+ superfamily ATPase